MYKIESQAFKTEAFKTGGKEWNDRVLFADKLVEDSVIEEGSKELVYSLASHGCAFTVVESRAIEVHEALRKEGFYSEVTYEI